MDSFQKKILFIVVLIVLYLLVVVLWIGGEYYIHAYINKRLLTIQDRYDVSVLYEKASVKGINQVEIKNPVILKGADTLGRASAFVVSLNYPGTFVFKPEISRTEVHDFRLNQTKKRSLSGEGIDNYVQKLERLLQALPQDMTVSNLRISNTNQNESFLLDIRKLVFNDSQIKADVSYQGAYCRFDSLVFDIRSVEKTPGIITLQGKGGVKGLAFFDERIASDTVYLNRGYARFGIDIGDNLLELDRQTTLYINKLKLNPCLKAERKGDWHIFASLDKEDFPAHELFESIPKGLFRHVEGLKADGTLTYHFLLDVDMADVERLKFRSTLDARNFRILQFGATDLRMMNEQKENPNFRSYKNISRYLPFAIMHAEDAEFYSHQGFLPDAFRRSLIQNIQERRFARGGSTLSMQVVKNAFLSQDKTIARKLEEIMIVWLIETNKLTSKQRMFEVYMNIIEWGPNVYGVTEAARYYFNKEPAALTLTECVFLAYILPDPKHVKKHFNGLQIEPAFRYFHADAVKRIYQRHWISGMERAMSSPSLRITGPAAAYLLE